jgi:hypothetical protein
MKEYMQKSFYIVVEHLSYNNDMRFIATFLINGDSENAKNKAIEYVKNLVFTPENIGKTFSVLKAVSRIKIDETSIITFTD